MEKSTLIVLHYYVFRIIPIIKRINHQGYILITARSPRLPPRLLKQIATT